jgi:hypothetical protein
MPDDPESAVNEMSWAGYRRTVLEGIARIERMVAAVDSKIDREVSGMETKFEQKNRDQDLAIKALEIDVGQLKIMNKVWAGLSGAVTGAIATAVAQLLFRVK